MLNVNELNGFNSAVEAELVFNAAYIGKPALIGSQTNTPYTFSNVNYGGAGLIVVVVNASFASTRERSIASVTLGGTAMTIHTNRSAQSVCAIASLNVTSGTSANIVVSMSATGVYESCSVAVYRIQNANSNTPIQAQEAGGTNALTRSLTMTTQAGGVVIAGCQRKNNAGYTWTNATENYEVANSTLSNGSGAIAFPVAGTSLTVTATGATGSVNMAIAAVSWR